MTELDRKEQTAAEIDSRIHDLCVQFLETGEATSAQVLGFLRSAYAQGYTDCLKEPEGQRGKWIKALGYGVKGYSL